MKKDLKAELYAADECPFCRTQVPEGATVCGACGAYKEIGWRKAPGCLLQVLVVVAVFLLVVGLLNKSFDVVIWGSIFAVAALLFGANTRQVNWWRRM